MRIIQELKLGEDLPDFVKPTSRLRRAIVDETRRRLELRPQDIVEVIFLCPE